MFESLFKTKTQEYYAKSLMKKNLGSTYQYLEAIEQINKLEGMQALMPMMTFE